MNKLKCKLGLHHWKYHNDITRQCLNCGKTQFKKKMFWHWIDQTYFPKGKEIEPPKHNETITIKKGVIILVPDGLQILNDDTHASKFLAHEFKEDTTIYPSYEYKQKCEVLDESRK